MSSASRARVWLVFSPHLSFRLWGPAAEHSSGGGGGGRGRVLTISGKLLGLEPMAFTAWICTLKIMGESEKEIEFICWILRCKNVYYYFIIYHLILIGYLGKCLNHKPKYATVKVLYHATLNALRVFADLSVQCWTLMWYISFDLGCLWILLPVIILLRTLHDKP